MFNITADLLLEKMREAVADKPVGYKYQDDFPPTEFNSDCYYQVNGKPACLIGEALHRMGVPYDPEWETIEAATVVGSLIGTPLSEHFRVVRCATAAQDAQDAGCSWAEALEFAEEVE